MPLLNNIVFKLLCLIVAVCAGALGYRGYADNVLYHDVISLDSISTIIDTYLVDTGLVDDSILELETPQEQVEMLGDQITELEKISSEIRSALILAGYSE